MHVHGCYAQRSAFLLLFLGSFSLQLLKFIRMLLRSDTIKLIPVILDIYFPVETFLGLPFRLDGWLVILVGVPFIVLFEFVASFWKLFQNSPNREYMFSSGVDDVLLVEGINFLNSFINLGLSTRYFLLNVHDGLQTKDISLHYLISSL